MYVECQLLGVIHMQKQKMETQGDKPAFHC